MQFDLLVWLVMIPSSMATQKRNTACTEKINSRQLKNRPISNGAHKTFCRFLGLNFIRMKWSRLLDKTQSEMQSVQFRDHLHLHAPTLIGLHVQIECFLRTVYSAI